MEHDAQLARIIVNVIERTCILNASGILQRPILPYDRERKFAFEGLLHGCKRHARWHLQHGVASQLRVSRQFSL
jgi:hypothetical protein